MATFPVDFSNVFSVVDKTSFKLSDVKDRLEKVAFDIFRMKDGDPDELWEVQSADDGSYIVCKYTDEALEPKTASAKTWEVLNNSNQLHIFYKGTPITKISLDTLSTNEISTVSRFLPKKLASDKVFVKALLNSVSDSEKQNILKSYPELV
jgi:hypothetical protein